MSDAVQMPPSLPVVPRVAPVRAAEHIDPPKKSQTENHSSDERRQESREAALQRAASADDRRMQISRDEAARRFVYRSVEAETGEVVWQYPAEQMLRRAKYLRQAEEQLKHEVDEKA
jgi:uncharacterized FlaG/YvyC family protein